MAERYPIIEVDNDSEDVDVSDLYDEVRTPVSGSVLMTDPDTLVVRTPKGEELVDAMCFFESTQVIPRSQLLVLLWHSTPLSKRGTQPGVAAWEPIPKDIQKVTVPPRSLTLAEEAIVAAFEGDIDWNDCESDADT